MSENQNFIHRVGFEDHFSILSNVPAEDEYLSFMAKGILWYILSRPKDWKIHRKHLASLYKGERSGNGIDAINSAFDELIEKKYIIYTKQDPKTGKMIHRYDVYPIPYPQFQKIFPKMEKPNLEKSNMGNSTHITSNDLVTRKEEQQQAAAAAAVFFDCLKDLEIPEEEKIWLMKSGYSEQEIKDAIAFTFHPETKIKKTPEQCIKWALKTKPKIPVSQEDNIKENILFSKKYQDLQSKYAVYEISPSGVSIYKTPSNDPNSYSFFSFKENGFKEKVIKKLKEYAFNLESTPAYC